MCNIDKRKYQKCQYNKKVMALMINKSLILIFLRKEEQLEEIHMI